MACAGRFIPGNVPVPTVHKSGWSSGPVWEGVDNLTPTTIQSPRPSSPQQVAIPTMLSHLPADTA